MNGLLQRTAASHIAASFTLVMLIGCEAPVVTVTDMSPDLMVTSASVRRERSSDRDRVSFTLSATVRNGGEGSSVPTMLRYYRSTDNTITTSDTVVGGDAIDGLGSGGTSSHSVKLTAPLLGTYSYGACVDVVPSETDTANNCSASVAIDDGPVTIGARDDDLLTYQGRGDHVFFLNRNGEPLVDHLYTLELGELATVGADVYLIATNTTAGHVTPRIEVDAAGASSRDHRTASRDLFPPLASRANGHGPARITEFEQLLPPVSADAALRQSRDSRQAVVEGDTYIFRGVHYGHGRGRINVAATARRVVTDGTTTFVLWVEDEEWGCSTCFNQAMVDAMAMALLRRGLDNDIFDWVTAVFGDPWGPHRCPSCIPSEYGHVIHMLLADIGPSGYFSARNSYLRSYVADSDERLLFYVASGTTPPRQEITMADAWRLVDVMVHEYQHLVYFYQKQVKHGPASYTSWLNEMASEVAEELVFRKFENEEQRGRPDGCTPEVWTQDYSVTGSATYYNVLCSLGIYLALNYGGVSLIGDIVRSERSGIDAIEVALKSHGNSASFGDVLTNWAVATVLSDNTQAPRPYRYNSGSWSVSEADGVTFRIAPVRMLLHWRPPLLFSVAEFNAAGAQPPHSNRFSDLGRITGTVRLRVNAVIGNRITVVVKE